MKRGTLLQLPHQGDVGRDSCRGVIGDVVTSGTESDEEALHQGRVQERSSEEERVVPGKIIEDGVAMMEDVGKDAAEDREKMRSLGVRRKTECNIGSEGGRKGLCVEERANHTKGSRLGREAGENATEILVTSAVVLEVAPHDVPEAPPGTEGYRYDGRAW